MAPPKAALDFIDFVNASPTPYHAVATASAILEKAGFSKIRERENWASSVRPGGKYYLTRNGSSLVAFAVGRRWRPGNPVAIVGTHTDSPVLRVKPVSHSTRVGFIQVGVETYGGGKWHTWFDRDLSLAGRVLVREEGGVVQKLVRVDKPLIRVPTLAIHLDRETKFDPNKETELYPIAGMVAAELNRSGRGDGKTTPGEEDGDQDMDSTDKSKESSQPLKAMSERHHPYILEIIAEHAGVDVEAVVDFELVLYDTQKSCIGGLNDEFIFSARLDNLNMTFCAVEAMAQSIESHSLDEDSTVRMIACFDHEEVGSGSAQGADSYMLPAILRRLSALPAGPQQETSSDKSYEHVQHHDADGDQATTTAFEQTLATSFLISADMAHSVHPNYVGKYEANHQPEMNKGTVLKINANQRYATNSPGIVLVQEAARRAGVPLQLFVVRNDSPCGSTIGPMLATNLGMRTLDLGNPQLSMHSIRETGGTHDVDHAIRLFASFFRHYGALEPKIVVD